MSNCLFYFQQFPSFNTEHVQFTPELRVAILTVHEISYARPFWNASSTVQTKDSLYIPGSCIIAWGVGPVRVRLATVAGVSRSLWVK